MGMLRYREPTGAAWVNIPTVGPMGPPGATGPSVTGATGPTGPTGTQGVSTIIVGSFGSGTGTPATLPPTGALVAGFTSPGSPAYQMVIGESLYYEAPTGAADPLDGHLFQFMTTAVNAAGWVDIGLIQGPRGPSGPRGACGPSSDEIWIGPDQPTGVATELWYDTDDNRILGPAEMPVGGLANDALVKNTDLDGDVKWRDLYTLVAGEVIQFPNVADVPKINLYSTTFGLGIESGTLTLFASSNIRFRQNSITGERFAEINAAGIHVDGTINPSTTLNVSWVNGFSGTATCRYTPAVCTIRLTNAGRSSNCDVGVQTKMFDYPSGFPGPPDVQTGYRVVAFERNDNFTRDNAARMITLHFDGSAAHLIATGDIFYSGKKFDAVITWAR